MTLTNKKTFFTAIIVLIGANIYLGLLTIEQWKDLHILNSPISVETLLESFPVSVDIVDIDNNGLDEVVSSQGISIPDELDLLLFNPIKPDAESRLEFHGEISIPKNYLYINAYYNETEKRSIFRFLDIQQTDFFLKELDYRCDLHSQLKLESLEFPLQGQGTTVFNPVMVELEPTGQQSFKPQLIFILQSFFKRTPRGVACFDPVSGKRLWQYYCGTLVKYMEIIDLDNDGRKEIILSSDAVNNGADMNGTSDAYSYVIVLDAHGNERWKQETGNWYTFSQSSSADLDNDGRMEIVTAVSCRNARSMTKGRILIHDGTTGEQKALFNSGDVSFSRPNIITTQQNETLIYVGDSSGCVWLFDGRLPGDGQLTLRKKVKVLNENTMIVAAKPGKSYQNMDLHYAYFCSQHRFIAFDPLLNEKYLDFQFQRALPDFVMDPSLPLFFPFRSGRGNRALLKADKLYLLEESHISTGETIKRIIVSGLPLTILYILLLNVFIIAILIRLRDGHLVPRLPDNTILPADTGPRFLETIQGIAHQVKNTGTTVLWTAEKMKRHTAEIEEKQLKETFGKLSGFLEDDALALKQQSNHLLKLIQIHRPCFHRQDLNPLLEELVNHYRSLTAENINIQLIMDETVSFVCDEALLKEALVNLVDNAVDAMPEGGRLTISAVPVRSSLDAPYKEVIIDVEDTGEGIDEGDLPEIFAPFFTRKQKGKGTGVGLTVCKQIIEAHKGTISVQSRRHFGTHITVTLPLLDGPKVSPCNNNRGREEENDG